MHIKPENFNSLEQSFNGCITLKFSPDCVKKGINWISKTKPLTNRHFNKLGTIDHGAKIIFHWKMHSNKIAFTIYSIGNVVHKSIEYNSQTKMHSKCHFDRAFFTYSHFLRMHSEKWFTPNELKTKSSRLLNALRTILSLSQIFIYFFPSPF